MPLTMWEAFLLGIRYQVSGMRYQVSGIRFQAASNILVFQFALLHTFSYLTKNKQKIPEL
jgi:hypothetical protein